MQHKEALQPECQRVRALLPALPDGDLHDADMRRVQDHLDQCAACKAEASALLRIGELLRAEPLPQVCLPSGGQVVTRILEREAARAPAWPVLTWTSGAALATLALVLALGLGAPMLSSRPVEHPVPQAAPGEAPLPALVVVDDEDTGRQVLLAPSAGG